ncbi:MAG: endopeptidase La [Candidatus Delongbacteria bacterium]|nr:endopeptidase La [Candidatus Delongbacteria bacterium]
MTHDDIKDKVEEIAPDDSTSEISPPEDDIKVKEDGILLATEILPEEIVIIPINQRPFFPGMFLPIILPPSRFKKSVDYLLKKDRNSLGLVLVKKELDDQLNESYFYRFGTIAKIVKFFNLPDGSIQLLVNTLQRFEIQEFISFKPHVMARVVYYKDEYDKDDIEIKAFAMAILGEMKKLIQNNPLFTEEMKLMLSKFNINDPGMLADAAISLTNGKKEDIQEVLETLSIRQRMEKVLLLLKKELELVEIQQKINRQIEEKITKQQREFFLREQLKAIKKELGLESDPKTIEIQKFLDRVKKLKLSQEARQRIDEEIDKLGLLEPISPEFNVSRTYLDWLTLLPWGKLSKENYDLDRAQRILDRDHYGLDDIKKRIIEFIAVKKIKPDSKGSILCFVGPPGVGKTSIGRSIAQTLNRKFYRFSLGGMRDEAEIKGHRRTYIGAMPGKIIQSIKVVGTANPVIMLDEIDKLAVSFQGDPAAALLEVLDPEQNVDFLDHYLDVRFDLSNILFIATANVLDTIPAPLLDRMEVLRLSGYIEKEKYEIARRYLLPKQLKAHGLKPGTIKISRSGYSVIINDYAKEAGVRALEKEISNICRKTATQIVRQNQMVSVKIQPGNIEEYLGKPKFTEDKLHKVLPAGVVMGLAWTSLGGTTLFIEAIAIPEKNRALKQTGQLGNVMIESSTIAYSYIMSNYKKFGITDEFFKENLIHLHVPAGATPKDGPSAGITMATALVSLALNRPVIRNLAMTGEITLTGKVLPIGGVKEKVIAARHAKVKTIILPEENQKDFAELPDHIKEGIEFVFVGEFDQVFQVAFGPRKPSR